MAMSVRCITVLCVSVCKHTFLWSRVSAVVDIKSIEVCDWWADLWFPWELPQRCTWLSSDGRRHLCPPSWWWFADRRWRRRASPPPLRLPPPHPLCRQRCPYEIHRTAKTKEKHVKNIRHFDHISIKVLSSPPLGWQWWSAQSRPIGHCPLWPRLLYFHLGGEWNGFGRHPGSPWQPGTPHIPWWWQWLLRVPLE